ILSVTLVIFNDGTILVDIYFKQFEIQIGQALVLSIFIGIVISLLFIGNIILSYRSKYVKLKKENNLVKKEVQNLRKLPMQE
ncbi:MAG: LapA family protein, partial [Pseudomonadota bacterium]|nr:LapA family protein [Pseudomonadota bacterium]